MPYSLNPCRRSSKRPRSDRSRRRVACARPNRRSAPPSPTWRRTWASACSTAVDATAADRSRAPGARPCPEILAADTRLQQLSVRLAVPGRSAADRGVLRRVSARSGAARVAALCRSVPEIELEWLDAEGEDVLELVGSGRAAGLLPRQESYGWSGGTAVGPSQRTVGVCGARPCAGDAGRRAASQLARYRQVRLSAEVDHARAVTGLAWTATDHLMVMEMADGIGWAELRALVQRYDRGQLVELTLPGGRGASTATCCGAATPPGQRRCGGPTRWGEVAPAAGRQSCCRVVAGQRPALPVNDGRARNPAPRTPLPPGRRCTAAGSPAGCPGRPRWWWCRSHR